MIMQTSDRVNWEKNTIECSYNMVYLLWNAHNIHSLHTTELANKGHIDGLVQDCSNSSALAMALLQSCIKPLTYKATFAS